MIAKIWEHWFTYYITYYNADGEAISQDREDSLEKAVARAKHTGAFVIVEK